jgi:hypothetical protein
METLEEVLELKKKIARLEEERREQARENEQLKANLRRELKKTGSSEQLVTQQQPPCKPKYHIPTHTNQYFLFFSL